MTTRLYMPSSGTAAISPTPDAAWEDVSILARLPAVSAKTFSAMTTVAFNDANGDNKDILFRQYVSAPLTAGQTITGAQALKAQIRGRLEPGTAQNMYLTLGVRVINNDLTVQKTVLAVTRDGVVFASSLLTNRQFTATSAATNYTTVTGDRLVFEVGVGGYPGAGSEHDSELSIGDASASDLPENDTSTADYNPWVELADTLTFGDGGGGGGTNVVVTPTTLALVLTRFAPTVTVSDSGPTLVTPTTLALVLTTYAPRVETAERFRYWTP